MAGTFRRSWTITKLSFGVIWKDKEILWYPLFAALFSIVFILAIIVPSIILVVYRGETLNLELSQYLFFFLLYFGVAFIGVFFDICVVYTAKKRFEGGNATFGESLTYAFTKIHRIFLWSLLSATVGIILRFIDRLARKQKSWIGRFVIRLMSSFLGMAWAILTIFVVPSMVFKNSGPFAAIKNSVFVLRKTWGESLIRYYGLGFVKGLFIVLGFIVTIILVFVLWKFGLFVILMLLLALVIYIVLVSMIFNVANEIFNTALYMYASTEKIPEGFDKEIMKNAFRYREGRHDEIH